MYQAQAFSVKAAESRVVGQVISTGIGSAGNEDRNGLALGILDLLQCKTAVEIRPEIELAIGEGDAGQIKRSPVVLNCIAVKRNVYPLWTVQQLTADIK